MIFAPRPTTGIGAPLAPIPFSPFGKWQRCRSIPLTLSNSPIIVNCSAWRAPTRSTARTRRKPSRLGVRAAGIFVSLQPLPERPELRGRAKRRTSRKPPRHGRIFGAGALLPNGERARPRLCGCFFRDLLFISSACGFPFLPYRAPGAPASTTGFVRKFVVPSATRPLIPFRLPKVSTSCNRMNSLVVH